MTASPDTPRILLGRYRLVRALGAGAHGTVHLAEDLGRGGKRVAFKQYTQLIGSKHERSPVEDILRNLRHPAWAAVLDGGPMPGGGFQVLRYIPGRAVDEVDGPLPVDEVWRLLEDGARVLRALHSRNVIHYDVTAGNLLREPTPNGPRFVLTDGGLAHLGPVAGGGRGTPRFMAPELTEVGEHDARVDLYSLGLVAFLALTGRDAFTETGGALFRARREGRAPRATTLRPDTPESLERILTSLLAANPAQRPADAHRLLEMVLEAQERPDDVFTQDELMHMAERGALIGRDAELERADRLLDRLDPNVESPKDTESVLLVTGERGMGCTHFVSEVAHRARQRGIPVILLAPTGQTADRRRLLRQVLDGLSHLGIAEGEAPADYRLPPHDDDIDEEHADNRDVEAFVKALASAATRVDFLLVVEDLAGLPPLANRALAATVRQAASLTASEAKRLRFSIVVDQGSRSPDATLGGSATDPNGPLLDLRRTSALDSQAIATDRLPSLAKLSDRDISSLNEHVEGLPGRLVGAIAEAWDRGDLQLVGREWQWNLTSINDYKTGTALSPTESAALSRLSPSQRTLVAVLSHARSGYPLAVVAAMSRTLGAEPLMEPALTVADNPTGHPTVSVNRRIGEAAEPSVGPRALASLLSPLINDSTVGAEIAAVLSRHALAEDDVGVALDVLSASLSRGLSICSSIVCDAIESSIRIGLARRLEEIPPNAFAAASMRSSTCASAYFETVPPDSGREQSELELVCHSVKRGWFQSVYQAHERRLDGASTGFIFGLEVARSRALANEGVCRATAAVSSSLRSLARRARRKGEASDRDLAHYTMLLARSLFGRGRPREAARTLRVTRRVARRWGDRAVLAGAHNTSGIVLSASGMHRRAARAWRVSASIRRDMGDLAGLAATLTNLGVQHAGLRHPREAMKTLREVLAVSIRHDFPLRALQALSNLSVIHDDQRNTRLALRTALQAAQLSARAGLHSRHTIAASSAAPLAAALGDRRIAAQQMRAASSPTSSISSLIGRLVAQMHLGLHSSARRAALSLLRREDLSSSSPDERAVIVAALTSLKLTPPEWLFPRLGQATPGLRPLIRLVRNVSAGIGPGLSPADIESLSGIGRRMAAELDISYGSSSDNQTEKFADRCMSAGEVMIGSRALARSGVAAHARGGAGHRAARAVRVLRSVVGGKARGLPCEFEELAGVMQVRAPSARMSLVDLEAALFRSDGMAAGETRSARMASALASIIRGQSQLRTGAGTNALIAHMVDSTLELTSAERACVVLLDRESGEVSQVESSASPEVEAISQAVLDRVLESGEGVLLHDVHDDVELLHRPSIAELSLRSILCVPIVKGEVVYGVIYADNASAAGSFDDTDLEVLSTFAEQVASTLEADRLVRSLQASMSDLRQAQDRLVRGERLRTIGEMSSGVAHEFNNLLTSILARIQLVKLTPLPRNLHKDLDLVEKAALDAAAVVRRLQSFSKQQRTAGHSLVDIRDIASDAIEFLRPLWSRRATPSGRVSVALDAPESALVRGDATELREVITNLVKNAFESLQGDGAISLSVAAADGVVRVRVRDTGPGIPTEIHGKIFDPFFTTKGERGTGLGLCLCQQIMDRHQGSLKLGNSSSEGTEFIVELPSAVRTTVDSGIRPEHSDEVAKSTGVSVLVVDDDENVRLPLADYLARTGYDVRVACDGQEALDMIRSAMPRLVLSDVSMPRMNGLELCRRLSREAPDLPVVLMSGWASSHEPSHAESAGAAEVLSKPFAMAHVTQVVSRHAGGSSSR